MSDNLNNFVALNSTYSTLSVLQCAYSYVMRVLNKMSMMTKLSLCVLCEFSRAVFVYIREGPPHFFLNRALPRLNPALGADVTCCGRPFHTCAAATGKALSPMVGYARVNTSIVGDVDSCLGTTDDRTMASPSLPRPCLVERWNDRKQRQKSAQL